MKPYYKDDAVIIYHGDCHEVLPELPKVGLVLTDQPYGMKWNSAQIHRGKNGNGKTGTISAAKNKSIMNDNIPFDPSFMLGFLK